MISATLRDSIARHALESYPNECCGLVVAGEYLPCPNASATPTEAFSIPAECFAEAEDKGTVEAVIHSHPGGRAQPSEHDLTVCESLGVPLWVIVSLGAQANGSVGIDNWYEFGPSGFEVPLLGVQFSHGTNDCYGLIRRYYWQTYGLALQDFPRGGHWWDDGESDLYTQGYATAGFESLGLLVEPQPGDVLLMKIHSRNNVPNHAAVYLGGDVIIHHTWGALSRRDQLPRYRDYVTHILRHKEVSKSNK